MTHHRFWASSALALLLITAGCGATRKSALDANPAGDAKVKVTVDAATLLAQAEEAWNGRSDKAKLLQAIDLWKKAFEADSKNAEPLVRLSRAHYFLADGHLRFEIDDEDARREAQAKAFGEGQYYGEKALLVMSPQFKSDREAEVDLEQAIPKLPKNAVPAIYWWATNLGKWAAAEGFITLLAHKDQVFSMMDFCIKQHEEFMYSAPHRYFGAYYTKIPLPSGDQARSKKHFDTAIAKAPNYLATRVLYAEYYAIKFQDRGVFDTHLKYVMDADVGVIPDLVPEHEIEKKKAAQWLATADDHFE